MLYEQFTFWLFISSYNFLIGHRIYKYCKEKEVDTLRTVQRAGLNHVSMGLESIEKASVTQVGAFMTMSHLNQASGNKFRRQSLLSNSNSTSFRKSDSQIMINTGRS